MRYIIIEDEPLAAEKLHKSIEKLKPNWELLQVIPSVQNALAVLPDLKPELLFLDVHLSDGNSFQIFESIDLKVPVIFTTAFDKYALKAFDLNSIDYLLKPITADRLKISIDKLDNRIGGRAPEFDWTKLIHDLKPNYKDRFMVTTGKRIKSLEATEIAYFFAQGKHAFITSTSGVQYLIDKTLSSLNEQLDPKYFFQINRQYIVRIDAIQEMISYSKGRLKIITNPATTSEAIVSTEKASRFKQWLEGE